MKFDFEALSHDSKVLGENRSRRNEGTHILEIFEIPFMVFPRVMAGDVG